jgi:hypothetical protein
MDPASLAVFTTLGINVVVTLLIFITWLCLRKHRGDRDEANKGGNSGSTERHRRSKGTNFDQRDSVGQGHYNNSFLIRCDTENAQAETLQAELNKDDAPKTEMA